LDFRGNIVRGNVVRVNVVRGNVVRGKDVVPSKYIVMHKDWPHSQLLCEPILGSRRLSFSLPLDSEPIMT
jgi:hypothetical protein